MVEILERSEWATSYEEQHIIRRQAAPREHFHRKEVRTCQHIHVRPNELAPGCALFALRGRREGKLHISVGESDGNFLNLAIYLIQDFLENTKAPYFHPKHANGRSESVALFDNRPSQAEQATHCVERLWSA
jgi:hypothetical protein